MKSYTLLTILIGMIFSQGGFGQLTKGSNLIGVSELAQPTSAIIGTPRLINLSETFNCPQSVLFVYSNASSSPPSGWTNYSGGYQSANMSFSRVAVVPSGSDYNISCYYKQLNGIYLLSKPITNTAYTMSDCQRSGTDLLCSKLFSCPTSFSGGTVRPDALSGGSPSGWTFGSSVSSGPCKPLKASFFSMGPSIMCDMTPSASFDAIGVQTTVKGFSSCTPSGSSVTCSRVKAI